MVDEIWRWRVVWSCWVLAAAFCWWRSGTPVVFFTRLPQTLGSATVLFYQLINRRSVLGLGNGLSRLSRSFEPCVLGDLDLVYRFFGRVSDGGAKFEIGDIGDVSVVFFAVEHVDVVGIHCSFRRLRPCRSTSFRSCLVWYGIAFPFTFCRLMISGIAVGFLSRQAGRR